VLTLGFAIAVSMGGGLPVPLPLVMAPAWLFRLMLAVVTGWGVFAGRRAVGWLSAVGGGALASVLNLLVLGGLLSTPGAGHRLPTVLLWVLGSTGVVAGLAGVAAALAGRGRSAKRAGGLDALFTRSAFGPFLCRVAGSRPG
jgi:hypothetical protein